MARTQKKYDAADQVDSAFLQKLSDEFIDGYHLLNLHEMYLPGDDEVRDVNVPLCMYQKFHEWTKDL